ncbi:MAG: hypothetical protein Q9214_002100 [Letrouitia sp. 1 TL-2023]
MSETAPDTTISRLRPDCQFTTGNEEHLDHLHSSAGKDEPSEEIPSDWSEARNVPKRNLGLLQAISLVINLVIGSGIFVNPGYVLALTRSKAICLILWAAGGVYTAIWYNARSHCPALLDVVFPKPELMAVVIFALHRIIFGTNESNCRSLAISLLLLANPTTKVSMLGEGAIKGVAVAICTVVCLLLYFVSPLCFVSNGPFAMMKVISLLVLFIAGIAASHGQIPSVADFNEKRPGYNTANLFLAMIPIISSYQGFINVNCTSGNHFDCNNYYILPTHQSRLCESIVPFSYVHLDTYGD